MTEKAQEFHLLIQRLREGSQEAAQELYHLYGHHILLAVRKRLHRRLRSKFDSGDFTQAVWASFFAEPVRTYQFENPEGLVNFLATVARRKVVETLRQRQTQKYDIRRELHSLNNSVGLTPDQAAQQPTPSQIAIGREELSRLLEGKPAHYQRIVILLSQGHTHKDIAHELGLNEKTVRRLVRRLMPEDE